MDSPNQEFIGVDVGAARVGLARGGSVARLAQPLKTVPAGLAIDEIIKLAASLPAAGVVVGLPRGLDGGDTTQTTTVRGWASQLKSQLELPIYWQDEALTSIAAQAAADIDAQAAALILQDFLDSPKSDRVAV